MLVTTEKREYTGKDLQGGNPQRLKRLTMYCISDKPRGERYAICVELGDQWIWKITKTSGSREYYLDILNEDMKDLLEILQSMFKTCFVYKKTN